MRDYALCGCRGRCSLWIAVERATSDERETAALSVWLDHVLERQRLLAAVDHEERAAA